MADKNNKGGVDAKNTAPGNVANVVALGDAQRELRRKQRGRDDPLPHHARGGAPPGKWSPNDLGLPKEDPCPIECIGIEGDLYHLIDTSKQFRSVAASDFSHAGIQSLFAATPNYPKWMAPRYGRAAAAKEGEKPSLPPIKSFEDDAVRELLFAACNRRGLFSPSDKLRGRGAWLMRGGQLVYHAGEELWINERVGDENRLRYIDTGMHGGHLYPRLAPLPAPWGGPLGADDNPAGVLLETFRKWNFERPAIDPLLLLGWCGVAYLGGALDWRSAVMLLGGHGTGKSELQKGLQALFGEHLMPSSDTTAPAIAQTLKQDTRAVACDELEAEADTRKVDAVVALMRAASSGDFRRRGSSDQRAVETHLRSAFLFSAINNPIQRAQDVSRIVILRLRDLNADQTRPPAIDAETCGRKILARLMSEWHRFELTRDAYMAALAAGGHVARGQKTYGTLLACADLLLGPDLAADLGVPSAIAYGDAGELLQNSQSVAWWAEALSADALPETEDNAANWRACLKHLLTAQVQTWRHGTRRTVGRLIEDLRAGSDDFPPMLARRELGDTGLGLLLPGEVLAGDAGWVLAVPNSHPLVADMFKGTVWAGSPGSGGPWKDALRQGPAHIVITDKQFNRVRIGGVQERCTLIALGRFDAAPER